MTARDRGSLITFMVLALSLSLFYGLRSARADGLYWERIPIQHTLPSRIFNTLGLTHTTRNGYTRGVPNGRDDNFPPGLTDIIPYDTMSLLIVRGTVEAVAVFREKVLALDVPQPTWTLQFRLIDPTSQTVLGLLVKSDALMDDSEVANISDGILNHPYRFHLYPASRGQVAIVLRTGVAELAPVGQPVFAPSVVWLNPVSKTTPFLTPIDFNDLASDRASAHTGLGAATTDPGLNYTVEITVTPNQPAPQASGAPGTSPSEAVDPTATPGAATAPAGTSAAPPDPGAPGDGSPPIIIKVDPPVGDKP